MKMKMIIFSLIFSLVVGCGVSFLGRFDLSIISFSLLISYEVLFIEYLDIISIPSLAKKFIKIGNKISISYLIGYLIVAVAVSIFWPKTDKQIQIRKIISNQIAFETREPKLKLTALEKKSEKGKGLSLDEIRDAERLRKQIEETEKYYKSGGFEKKETPPTSTKAKPEEKKESPASFLKNKTGEKKPVSADLLKGAYFGWRGMDSRGRRSAILTANITGHDEYLVVFISGELDGEIRCVWKDGSQRYEGKWDQKGVRWGSIILIPDYENGLIVSFHGQLGEKNGSLYLPCWLTVKPALPPDCESS